MQRKRITASRLSFSLLSVALLAGCADEDPQVQLDTGAADTGSTDSGAGDVGGLDAAEADAGTDVLEGDTGAEDATATDTGATDTGATDTGETDTGETDTGETDTGETCDEVAAAAEALGAVDAVSTGTVEATGDAESGWTFTIDASAGGAAGAATEPYVYVDITTGEAVPITDLEALESGAWWLAFKRATIRTNSADSGGAGLMLTRADGVPFDDAAMPGRDAEWATDDFIDEACEVVTEGRDTPVTAFSVWYDYNPETHAVTPTENAVFFVYEPVSHAVHQIAITGWDDGVFTLRVKAL